MFKINLDKSPEDQRAIADNLLEKLKILDPTCIVAGGCVRDWFANKSAKDIDVFMYDGGESSTSNHRRLEKYLGITLTNLSKEYTGSNTDNHISAVFEGYYEDQLINLILWKKKTFNVTHTFPAFNVKMHYLPEYGGNKIRWFESLLGFSHIYCKEIYVTDDINTKYWKKLRDKFPDCKIILLQGNQGIRKSISAALAFVEDWGQPTDAELDTIPMVVAGEDLRKSWMQGTDITYAEDFVKEKTESKRARVKEVDTCCPKELPW